jgi:NADH-quinone oxidoreductase subunit G
MKEWASVLLPLAAFAEASGTFVNAEGRWQSWAGCVAPPGEARPGWKILRVLGNLLGLPGFDYNSTEEVRNELRALAAAPEPPVPVERQVQDVAVAVDLAPVPIYGTDSLVRRAESLQKTALARAGTAA